MSETIRRVPCMKVLRDGDYIGAPCRECGHAMVLHKTTTYNERIPAYTSTPSCALCRLEIVIAEQER